MQRSGLLHLAGQTLDYTFAGPPPDEAPTLVLLHEGLGCAALWGDFPQRLVAETGLGVFAYSRAGYGASSPVRLPRPLDYMHREATLLPDILDAIDFRTGFLVGHSDGASIATIYAGAHEDRRLHGISLIAPHFVVEDMTVAAIGESRVLYETTSLREKLSRWHHNVDNAFYGWNGAWLDPAFRQFDLTGSLAELHVPVQIIQGEEDQYGTSLQIDIARQQCHQPVEVVLLPEVRHSPHREAPAETLGAIAAFVAAKRTTGRHSSG